MIDSVEMWSPKAQAIVTWKVQLLKIKTGKGNDSSVLLLTHEDEEQRYSPNTTEYELWRYVENANRAQTVGHSNREEAVRAEEARNG